MRQRNKGQENEGKKSRRVDDLPTRLTSACNGLTELRLAAAWKWFSFRAQMRLPCAAHRMRMNLYCSGMDLYNLLVLIVDGQQYIDYKL